MTKLKHWLPIQDCTCNGNHHQKVSTNMWYFFASFFYIQFYIQGCHGHGKIMEFLEKSWNFYLNWKRPQKSHGILKEPQQSVCRYRGHGFLRWKSHGIFVATLYIARDHMMKPYSSKGSHRSAILLVDRPATPKFNFKYVSLNGNSASLGPKFDDSCANYGTKTKIGMYHFSFLLCYLHRSHHSWAPMDHILAEISHIPSTMKVCLQTFSWGAY